MTSGTEEQERGEYSERDLPQELESSLTALYWMHTWARQYEKIPDTWQHTFIEGLGYRAYVAQVKEQLGDIKAREVYAKELEEDPSLQAYITSKALGLVRDYTPETAREEAIREIAKQAYKDDNPFFANLIALQLSPSRQVHFFVTMFRDVGWKGKEYENTRFYAQKAYTMLSEEQKRNMQWKFDELDLVAAGHLWVQQKRETQRYPEYVVQAKNYFDTDIHHFTQIPVADFIQKVEGIYASGAGPEAKSAACTRLAGYLKAEQLPSEHWFDRSESVLLEYTGSSQGMLNSLSYTTAEAFADRGEYYFTDYILSHASNTYERLKSIVGILQRLYKKHPSEHISQRIEYTKEFVEDMLVSSDNAPALHTLGFLGEACIDGWGKVIIHGKEYPAGPFQWTAILLGQVEYERHTKGRVSHETSTLYTSHITNIPQEDQEDTIYLDSLDSLMAQILLKVPGSLKKARDCIANEEVNDELRMKMLRTLFASFAADPMLERELHVSFDNDEDRLHAIAEIIRRYPHPSQRINRKRLTMYRDDVFLREQVRGEYSAYPME